MAEPDAGRIRVEVVYALPDAQTVIALELPQGATIAQAIAASCIVERHPGEIDPASAAVGVFGKRKSLQTALADGDRVEIYRPLIADAKASRRARARRRR